ncbi:MAG: hypothetical protein H5T69_06590 [Chloroflexi bacterium]|nr:hypothetical protein [Chloroflexota bacterium]
MARRATAIKQYRATGKSVLLLDAGDSLLNDKDPARATRGRISIELMNKMGYDAMTLGSLDLSLLSLDELRQRIAEARFAVLSANVFVAGSQELLAEPYRIIELEGHQVAILGLSDPLPAPVPPNVQVSVADPLETARQYLPELRQKAEVVVLLSHAGIEANKKIAQQVEGIDVIVSGRNPTSPEAIVVEPYGTLIVHADQASPGLAGERIGKANLGFDAKGNLTRHSWETIALDSSYADDTEIKEYLAQQSPK